MKNRTIAGIAIACICSSPVMAEWTFVDSPSPNAFIQSNDSTLELQCDRIRFAPAGYEDSQDIVAKQGLSIRFLANGTTEAGAFQVGNDNATLGIVDNYPVEVIFRNAEDYVFVLDQMAANAAVNLSMIDQDVTYGIFDLKGASAAVQSLKSACRSGSAGSARPESPEGVVYCGGGGIKRQIEFLILETSDDKWNARVTVNGETIRAMTAYSYFGNTEPPAGFVVALLGEDRSEFLVFRDGSQNWLEYGDYRYDQCN